MQLEHVIDLCPNLEELHWTGKSAPITEEDVETPPISATNLRRLRVLTHRFNYNSRNGAMLTSVMLSAPLLEKIFLEGFNFGAADVEALHDALRTRTALQSLRLAYLRSGRDPKEDQLLDALRERMRTCCPRLQDGGSDYYFWKNHFCKDPFSKTNYI